MDVLTLGQSGYLVCIRCESGALGVTVKLSMTVCVWSLVKRQERRGRRAKGRKEQSVTASTVVVTLETCTLVPAECEQCGTGMTGALLGDLQDGINKLL